MKSKESTELEEYFCKKGFSNLLSLYVRNQHATTVPERRWQQRGSFFLNSLKVQLHLGKTLLGAFNLVPFTEIVAVFSCV